MAGLQATLYYAASCKPSPGYPSIAFVIRDQRKNVLKKFSAFLGYFTLTSNAAHYKALIAGLEHALQLGITIITALGHCQLVSNQVNGNGRAKQPMLKMYMNKVLELSRRFEIFWLRYIPRQENLYARDLAQRGLKNTFVDRSLQTTQNIQNSCGNADAALQYIKEHRSHGCRKIRYILETISHSDFYLTVFTRLIQEISQGMGGIYPTHHPASFRCTIECIACLTAMYESEQT